VLVELKDYILPLRRWWWLILASTVIATISAYAATRQQPPIYQARSTIIVGRAFAMANPSGDDVWLTQQLANTYADIAKREPVQAATKASLGIQDLPDYRLRVVPNTQLIEISVEDTSPQRAQAVANEVATQLIRQSPVSSSGGTQQRQDFINQQLSDLEVKIKETQAEITKKQTDLAGLFSARQIADAQTQITGQQTKLNSLQANYTALLANTQQGALNRISVIEPATLPTQPVGPNKMATILLAAAIGLLLAVGAAYLLEYLDDTLKNPEEVQKTLGLTTLGTVPVTKFEKGSELVVMTRSPSPSGEAYRVLRTNLQFAAVDHPLTTLMVTSPGPSEGKSTTAANLAAALAQFGRRTILLDADLHRPRLHHVFGLRNNTGVTTALIADDALHLGDLLQETSVPLLQVLTSGPIPPNPAELLGSSRMRQLLADLLARADVVVLDSPPVMALSDAAILSTQVDGVLLVLDAANSRREVARRAVAALQRVHGRIIGVLLNRVPTRGAGYEYQYGYSQYYTAGDGTAGSSGSGGNGRGPRGDRDRVGRKEAAQ
jgi:capsular exopolysaccharide synthesis family protein